MKERPVYLVESVDNALLLIHLLRTEGRVRVTEAAEHLGVAPSTAHRLLTTLAFRDFAVQGAKHEYLAGPALPVERAGRQPIRELRQSMLPLMEQLSEVVGETVQLMIRVGNQTRFIASVESIHLLRVGDRQGSVLPADRTTGGKALLAELTDDEIRDTCGELADQELHRLLIEVRHIRRLGYSVNVDKTESGVSAIGMALRDETDHAVAALAIALPTVRFRRADTPRLTEALAQVCRRAQPLITARFPSDISRPGDPLPD